MYPIIPFFEQCQNPSKSFKIVSWNLFWQTFSSQKKSRNNLRFILNSTLRWKEKSKSECHNASEIHNIQLTHSHSNFDVNFLLNYLFSWIPCVLVTAIVLFQSHSQRHYVYTVPDEEKHLFIDFYKDTSAIPFRKYYTVTKNSYMPCHIPHLPSVWLLCFLNSYRVAHTALLVQHCSSYSTALVTDSKFPKRQGSSVLFVAFSSCKHWWFFFFFAVVLGVFCLKDEY